MPQMRPARGERLEEDRAERDQHDQAQVQNGVTERGPEARQNARFLKRYRHREPPWRGLSSLPSRESSRLFFSRRIEDQLHSTGPSSPLQIYLIEHTAIVEVALLRFLPATEEFIYGEKLHLGEAAGIFGGNLGRARPVVMARTDLLALRGV